MTGCNVSLLTSQLTSSRTPIQPIVSLTEILSSRIKDTEDAGFLEVVSRNAKRLHQLTEDILDVTKIESKSLVLNKEKFDLNEIIANAINDTCANTGSFYWEESTDKIIL